MPDARFFARLMLVCWPAAAFSQAIPTQTDPQQQTPAQQPKSRTKPDPVDSADPVVRSKDDSVLDPTRDPAKDAALDITKDPTKDPDIMAGGNDSNDSLLGADAAGASDYNGPAILSRSFALSRPAVAVDEHLKFFVGVNFTEDSGVTGAYVQTGQSGSARLSGIDTNWGASAKRYRRKDIFEFNYTGHYFNYFTGAKYNGQDQALTGGYTRALSHRVTLGFRETGGLYANTYSVLNSTAIQDVSMASATIVVAPNTEAFSDQTYYSTTTGTFTYKQSARLSFSLGGAFFLVHRDSQFLADTKGYQATADMAYRLTRRQTLGAYYAHSEYSFHKIFGDADADSVGANYAISLDRNTDLSVRMGGTRYSSQNLALVVPNLLVQQVLGITAGIEKYYFVGYAPDVTATLSRRLKQSSFGATYTQGITPGNGLILTSKRQSESVFFNSPTFRKVAAQFGAGRDDLSGYSTGTGTPGNYLSYYVRMSLSRPVTRTVSSYFNIDYRQYRFNVTNYSQNEYRISIGFRFSPGEGTLKVW